MLCARLVDGRPRHKRRAGRGRGAHKGSYGTVRTGDEPKRRHQGPPRTQRAAGARRPRGPGRARAVNRHGRTNLGPLAARPHLSPVPDRLPGRPTSNPGGPGLRRLYGLFLVGCCRSGNSRAVSLLRKIRQDGVPSPYSSPHFQARTAKPPRRGMHSPPMPASKPPCVATARSWPTAPAGDGRTQCDSMGCSTRPGRLPPVGSGLPARRGARRHVSYPMSNSMSCRRRANEYGSENRSDKPGSAADVPRSRLRRVGSWGVSMPMSALTRER